MYILLENDVAQVQFPVNDKGVNENGLKWVEEILMSSVDTPFCTSYLYFHIKFKNREKNKKRGKIK